MRLGLLAALAIVCAAPAAMGAAAVNASTPRLHVALGRALASPHVAASRTSALAVDVRTGRVLFQRHASLSLAPASAEKLTVAFTALRLLGPSFRFRTEVRGTGERVAHEWRGNLYLVGFGDPTLDPRDLGRLARQVRAWGITHVTGSVIADEHYYDSRRGARGWKPYFVGYESRPLSALDVHGTRLTSANSSAHAAAGAFMVALEHRGVGVAHAPRTGRAPADVLPLALDVSAPLATIVEQMDHESDNFIAEMLLKQLGAAVGPRGSTVAGAAVVRAELARAGVPVAGVRIVDGSGLSLLDRLTTRALVTLLRIAARDPAIREPFLASLPVAGRSGTLRDRLRRPPVRGRVLAKTGTTSLSCSLAGYVRHRYAFAILQNGSPVDYWSARAAQDRFVTVLARS